MSTRRVAKASQAIREAVSNAVLFELRDPRIKNVTVTAVEASGDLRTAKVYVSVMGDEGDESLCLHGLNSARGYIQSKVADRVQTRYTPVLTFVVDRGIKSSIEASRLLRELNTSENNESIESQAATGEISPVEDRPSLDA